MLRLATPSRSCNCPANATTLRYLPLGVGVVIPPWNFPLAILAGMTAAALVSGNTVVVKPSSDTPPSRPNSPKCSTKPASRPKLHHAGGQRREVGDLIVDHPARASSPSPVRAKSACASTNAPPKTHPGQIWIKRVIAEMGGKDAIIVDDDADLDAAAAGVVASAFGYQGQKCSACSRLIVHEGLRRRSSRRSSNEGGPPGRPGRRPRQPHGPGHQRTLPQVILKPTSKSAREEGRLVTGGAPPRRGYFLQPTIIADVPPSARSSRRRSSAPCSPSPRRATSNTPSNSPTTANTASPAPSTPPTPAASNWPPTASTSATSTQPQVHRRHGRRAPLRRFQYVRHRLQSRRPRLPASGSSRPSPSPTEQRDFVCLLDKGGKAVGVYLKPLLPAAPGLARR
jgi:hypothetical protein